MKNNILWGKWSYLTVTALCAASLNSCSQKPSERPSVVDKKIAANLMELKSISEATGGKAKNLYFSGEKKDLTKILSLKEPDASLNQVKTDATFQTLMGKIGDEKTKKAITDHLGTSVVALVVLNKEIKIFKVVPDKNLSLDYNVVSFKYMNALKDLTKATTATAQAAGQKVLTELMEKSPSELSEQFGYVEVASVKIKSMGTLENLRTDYNEKRSILGVVDRPIDQSTHIILEDAAAAAAE